MGMNLCHYIATHQNLLQSTPPYGDEHTKRKSLWNSTRIITTHTPHGDEHHTTNWKETIIYFNTHPRMGMNINWTMHNYVLEYFNPHPHMGDELFINNVKLSCIILQLTSPYGDEQEIILNWLFTVYIFQSTPPHGDERQAEKS